MPVPATKLTPALISPLYRAACAYVDTFRARVLGVAPQIPTTFQACHEFEDANAALLNCVEVALGFENGMEPGLLDQPQIPAVQAEHGHPGILLVAAAAQEVDRLLSAPRGRWETQFPISFAPPAWLLAWPGAVDTSYCNDSCPSIQIPTPTRKVWVYVEHQDPELREMPSAARYMVLGEDPDEPDAIDSTSALLLTSDEAELIRFLLTGGAA